MHEQSAFDQLRADPGAAREDIEHALPATSREQQLRCGAHQMSSSACCGKAISILDGIVAAEERVLKEPEDKRPHILTDKLSDYSIDVIVRVWSQNSDYWGVRWALTKEIKEKLEISDISMALTTRQLAVGEEAAT